MRLVLSLAACLLVFSGMARAADISLTNDRDFNCRLSLTGPIEAGDGDRLIEKIREMTRMPEFRDKVFFNPGNANDPIDTREPMTICLDSPGGSFVEAVKMMDIVRGNFGTAIGPGKSCLSACSLVFMAGSFATDMDAGVVLFRMLDARGTLGFHAPSLSVPQGRYDETQVEKAYNLSLAATGELIRRHGEFEFASALLAAMFATPRDRMFLIDTVGEAARWSITVTGIPMPQRVTDDMVKNACNNAYLTAIRKVSSDPSSWFALGIGSDMPVKPENSGARWSKAYSGFGAEGMGTCVVSKEQKPTARHLGETTANVPALTRSNWGGIYFRNAVPTADYHGLAPFILYPARVRLATLASGNLRTDAAPTQGRCRVFGPDANKIDENTCTLHATVDGDGSGIYSYHWPSGAKTVVEVMGRDVAVNGNRGWPSFPDSFGATGDCFYNGKSRNTFCFEEAS